MQIVLIRHGKTRGNLEGRYVGRTDEPLLPEEIRRLQESSYRSFAPDVVYTSQMLRCRQTAEILFAPHVEISFGRCLQNQKKRFVSEILLLMHPGLNETDFGAFEYKNYEELKDNSAYQAWIDSGGLLGFPGGESGTEFRARCRAAFLECIADAKERNAGRAAFVVHGGTMMAVMEAFAVPRRSFYDWQVKNGKGFWAELGTSAEGSPVLSVLL